MPVVVGAGDASFFGLQMFASRLLLLLFLPAAQEPGPMVRIATLDGKSIQGELTSIRGDAVAVAAQSGAIAASIKNMLTMDFGAKIDAGKPPIRVVATDGTRLNCRSYVTEAREAVLTLTSGQKTRVSLRQVVGVLLVEADEAEAAKFAERALTPRANDVLRVQKDGKRFDLDGIVGAVRDDGLTFTLDGEELPPIKRERLLSILYANKPEATDPQGEVLDRYGNVYVADQIAFESGLARFRAFGAVEHRLPAGDLSRFDFSRGRLVFLSDLEPTLAQHTPFFDTRWDYQRDHGYFGRPIKLAGERFAKGLILHSRTKLEYDLGGKYRRFEATVGIDDSADPKGDAAVRILGDGKTLWEGRVRAGQQPQALSLVVEATQKLLLEVDYGLGLDVGDIVAFGNARAVK